MEIETVQLSDPKPGDVLARIVGSGVCGSNLHLVDGELPMYANPIVPGHEAAGIVEAVGAELRYVRPGDHVVLGWIRLRSLRRLLGWGDRRFRGSPQPAEGAGPLRGAAVSRALSAPRGAGGSPPAVPEAHEVLMLLEKPVIARVNGDAIGVGMWRCGPAISSSPVRTR